MATGSRTPWVRQQFFDDNGNPLSGGLIDTYIAGSTTPINTYTDITLTTIHTNPIVLNTRGETTIFLDPTVAYKFVLRNPLPDGSEIWTQDNITALGGNSLLTDLGVIRSKIVGSTTLPVPLATNVVIPYNTADYEVNLTGFDGAANKWVCALDGVYDLNAAVDFTIQSSLAAPSASCEIFFLVNGVTSKNPKKWAFTTGTGGGQKTLETSGTLQLNKNDEVQVVFISATQGSGTSIDLILTDAFWDIISLSGVKGNTGDQGPAGPAGPGVPVGGTANQVLAKIDATDYNTQWVNDTSSPSQGAQNVFNVANGSGGWTALNSVSLPIFFRYDPVDGLIKNTGAPIYTDGAISSDNYVINNNTGQIIFAETGSSVITTEMGRLQVSKDSLGTGLHALEVQGFKQLYLGLVDFHVAGEIKFPVLVDPGTDTNKTMLVVDSTSGVVQKRPIPTSGGSPSQGVQYVVNVADGSGGWTALDGSSVPLFKLDSTTGVLNFTGASGFLTNILQATDYININDDAGSLNFKDSSNSSMVDLSVQKDLHGTGLHQLDVNGANKFNIDSEIKIITFDPGTNTNKVMLVQDTNTRLVEKRPIPSSTDNTKLAILNNLSDLNSVPTARTNLGLGTAALLDVGTSATNIVQLDALAKLPAVDGSQLTNISATDNTKLAILNNLSDLNNSTTARTNLGLGTSAVLDTGTGANNIVQLDGTSKLPAVDGSQLTNVTGTDNTKLAILNNLSDLNSAPTARTNLGLGTAAVLDVGTSANNIVQLDGTGKLPAVDGSQLTNLPGGTSSALPIMVLKSNAADAGFGPTIGSLIVPWNIETYKDTGFSHSNTTNTSRAIVDNDGTYLIQGRLRVFNSVNQRAQPIVNILKNGVLLQGALDSSYIRNASGASDYWTLTFAYEPTKLLANDYIEVELDLDIGSTSTFNSSLLKAADSSLSIINLQGTKGDTGAQGPGGTDTNAVHVNVANEIAQITAKPIPSVDDVLIIEDSADSNNKKKVTIGTLRNGVESFTNPSSLAPDASLITQINANAQAQTLTLSVPTNPFDGAKVIYRIRAASTSTLTWNAAFNDLKGSLPTSAPINKSIYVGVIYDAFTSNWDVVSVVEQS